MHAQTVSGSVAFVLPISFCGVLSFPVDPGVVGVWHARGNALELDLLLLDALHRSGQLSPLWWNLNLKKR